MLMVYVYVLDTLADWELGQVLAELSSGRFFKKGAPRLSLKTVGCSKEPVRTMGGLTILPALSLDAIASAGAAMLLLPGAETWSDPKHSAVLEKAGQFLSAGAAVAAICGATAALADFGLLDRRPHTSNGPGFLDTVCARYAGQKYYVDAPAAADGGLITAGSAGALPWAKEIIRYLDVFEPDTLEAWYAYFSTGAPEHFFALLQSLPGADRG